MKIIAAYDHDPDVVACYNLNREPVCRVADLQHWRMLDIPTSHGIIAGPPCQDASIASNGRADRGRSALYVETARIIADRRPEWALIENVLTMRRRSEYRAALDILTNAGYWITVHTMIHADFGGATTRKRLFVVASRRMLPMPGATCRRSKWTAHGPLLEPLLARREPDGWGGWSLDKARVHEYSGDATWGNNWGGEGPTFRPWNQPYFTIMGGDKARDKSRWGGEVWALTESERAMLQGFPDGYQGLTHQMVGNAVPWEIARAWGYMVKSVFGDAQEIVSLFSGAGGFDSMVDV